MYAARAMFKNHSILFTIAVVFICAIFISRDVGQYRALNKQHYLVIEKKDKYYAVISNYDNKFVIAPVNLEKGIIRSKFQFIEMKSEKDDKLELSYVNTGKLKVQTYKFTRK